MALRDLLSSRLFSGRKKEAETEQLGESQSEPVLSPEEVPMELNLPPEHPLMELWSLYGEEMPTPQLSFETPDQELPENNIAQQLPKLEQFVTSTARNRLARCKALQTGAEAGGSVLDAEAQVFVTGSSMTAWVLAYPPYSGAELNVEQLNQALQRARVFYGVDEAFLERLPTLPERYFRLFPIAFGTPPVHGEDGSIIDEFSRSPTRTIMEDESGHVDYAAAEVFQNAKKGDVICWIIQPTPCSNGRNVRDQPVPARPGKAPAVPRGRNTELSEDGKSLIASRDGHVEFSGRSFQVKPVLDIGGDVDFSTGNINCLGDIHIHGDVCSGFIVRATGNITVDGVVEASTIEAGNDLVVRKGVQGNKQAVIRAHRNILARYLENCSVYARENLDAECIVGCDVYSDGTITVRSGRGAIIGGQVRAAHMVSANIVGARSGCRTVVALGGRPCEEFERQSLTREILDMEALLKKVDRQPDGPAKQRQMAKLRVQISADKMKLQQFDKRLEMREKEEEPALKKQALQGRLVCSQLFPGTEITIADASLKVTHETRMCTATLVDDEISLD